MPQPLFTYRAASAQAPAGTAILSGLAAGTQTVLATTVPNDIGRGDLEEVFALMSLAHTVVTLEEDAKIEITLEF